MTEENTVRMESVDKQSTLGPADSFWICVERAKGCVEKEMWAEAIAQYEQAITLRSDAPTWIYVSLGSLLIRLDCVDEAITHYNKAISLNFESARPHALLGVALEKKGLVSDAIASYSQALAVEPDQPAWLHTRLADLLSQRAVEDYKRAAVSYLQSMAMRDRFFKFNSLTECIEKIYGFSGNRPERDMQELLGELSDKQSLDFATRLVSLGFLKGSQSSVNPAGYYFINERLKIVYCSIPKNACTLFKTMMIESSGLREEFEASGDSVHVFLNKRIKKIISAAYLLECLGSADYFKFTVLRNPFDRLVSGYLDKLAKHIVPEAFAQDVILSVQRQLDKPIDIERSITFSQFVDYLVRTPDIQLNDHWRPQFSFIGSVGFDFIGQFEAMDDVISVLENKFPISIQQQVSKHLTSYGTFDDSLELHNLYPSDLRALGKMPYSSQLFTRELRSTIQSRYRQDIEVYKHNFPSDARYLLMA